MKSIVLAVLLSLLSSLGASPAAACTIFASHKGYIPFAGKIRDTMSHHNQELRRVEPRTNSGEVQAYFGLFAADGPESITFSPLKMGVNESGVFVGFATASSVPSQVRRSLPFFKDLTHHLLTRARTAKEAFDLLTAEDSPLGLRIMLIADSKESYLIENGMEDRSLAKVSRDFATNHFQSRQLRHLNVNSAQDSRFRLESAELLLPLLDFLPAEDSSKILDSLWVPRSTKKSTHTRSDFVVYYPPGLSPVVRVRMENDGVIGTTIVTLSSLFRVNACPARLLSAR